MVFFPFFEGEQGKGETEKQKVGGMYPYLHAGVDPLLDRAARLLMESLVRVYIYIHMPL